MKECAQNEWAQRSIERRIKKHDAENDKNSKMQCSGKLIHVLRFPVEQPPQR